VEKVASKGLEAHKHNREFEENETTDIGKSQRLWKEDNTRIIKVSGMRPGFARIIEKVRISRNIQLYETDLHSATKGCWMDYTDH
jgi:hypothetical protein